MGYPVYSENETAEKLRVLFHEKCLTSSRTCDFVVRAPGRVNLIGEHLDYNGYAVLPMALDKAIYAAAGEMKQLKQILIMSEDESLEKFSGSIDEAMRFAASGPPMPFKWFHYILCGYQAIYDYASTNFDHWEAPSLCLLVGNDPENPSYIPQCAGLSSSSALVVAGALATMRISGIDIDAEILADLCAESERLIGTQGGGMDQSACLLADKSPLLIDFRQLKPPVKRVTIPADGVFVIADTCARFHKATTPEFNLRVAQCREAVQVLVQNCPNKKESNAVKNLYQAQLLWGQDRPGTMLEGENSPFAQAFRGREDSLPALRAKHVFSEADRVLRFQELCSSARRDSLTSNGNDEDRLLVQLGELMNTSHTSCRYYFQCSSPELDKLVEICRASGSLGTRMTGAGWGGCVVSLVRRNQVQQLIELVASRYYGKPVEKLSAKLFCSPPGRAACFFVKP